MKMKNWLISIALSATLALLVACGAGTPDSPSAPRQPASVSASAPTPAPAQQIEYTPVQPAQPLPPEPAALPIPAIPAMPALPVPPSPPVIARAVPTSTPQPKPLVAVFPVTVEDGNGNTVVFDTAPERIVAFDSAVVEILFSIGEGDRVVGTHDFVTSPPEANDVLRVGGAFNMDIEATVALEPDLVFIFFDRFKEDLERAGLKVLFIATLTDDFIQVADRIRLWGDIVGNPANAELVASDFEFRVQAITQIMADYAAGPTVFQDEGALWTPGQGTLIQQVFDVLKLENIASDVVGYEQISPEVIVERNPSIIIASY